MDGPTRKRNTKTSRRTLDPAFLEQVLATEATLVEHLEQDPASLTALYAADFLVEIHAGAPPAVREASKRLRALRAKLGPEAFARRARDEGAQGLMTSLWNGARGAKMGEAAYPALLDRIVELSDGVPELLRLYMSTSEQEAGLRSRVLAAIRDEKPGFRMDTPCLIDASLLPEPPRYDEKRKTGVRAEYYPNGHLKRLAAYDEAILKRSKQSRDIVAPDGAIAFLALDERPGSGRYARMVFHGGYGRLDQESYRGGAIHYVINSPWHDGVEGETKTPWVEWVLGSIESVREAGRLPVA
jgi:hypothetical protein